MKISCKFGEPSWCSFPLRALTAVYRTLNQSIHRMFPVDTIKQKKYQLKINVLKPGGGGGIFRRGVFFSRKSSPPGGIFFGDRKIYHYTGLVAASVVKLALRPVENPVDLNAAGKSFPEAWPLIWRICQTTLCPVYLYLHRWSWQHWRT